MESMSRYNFLLIGGAELYLFQPKARAFEDTHCSEVYIKDLAKVDKEVGSAPKLAISYQS